jgi:hypothetical protein
MVDSGIKTDDIITSTFNDLKLNRTLKCIILNIDSSSQLSIEFKGDKTFQYKDLVDKLPKSDPRYNFLRQIYFI